ncbi:MAG TPA: glycosyltransferase family 4 protein [bacterium]|nr:glycosyltransferase family 4 protein [bacterium]HPS28784.1 glycosyltransferase family 4 protein [bacterium]
MKIGLVSNMYPSENDRKYGIFVKGMADSLSKKGVEFTFMCLIKGKEPKKFKKALKYGKLYICTVFSLLFKRCNAVYFHYPLHLAPLLYILSFFLIKPVIVNFHGTDLQPGDSKVLNFFDKLLFRVMKTVRLTVVPSDYLKKQVCDKFHISEESVFVSPSGGVDFNLFKMADDNPAGIKEYSAGFISRISPEKGWSVFINALDLLKKKGVVKDHKFLLAGSGPDEKQAEKMISDLNLEGNITFIKTTEQSRFPGFFNSLDVFIFPSYSESLGLVGLEAMACGTPVIGSNIGGISQYLADNENGFFFEKGSSEDLAEKIEKYMSLSKVEKMRLRDSALNTAKDFDRDRISALLFKKLKSVIDI